MKFRMYFGWLKTTLVSVVILAGVVVVVLDAVMLSGEVSALITANKPVAGVSLAAGALLTIAASLLLGNSYYKFRDDELFVMMGVFGDSVEYDTVRKSLQECMLCGKCRMVCPRGVHTRAVIHAMLEVL